MDHHTKSYLPPRAHVCYLSDLQHAVAAVAALGLHSVYHPCHTVGQNYVAQPAEQVEPRSGGLERPSQASYSAYPVAGHPFLASAAYQAFVACLACLGMEQVAPLAAGEGVAAHPPVGGRHRTACPVGVGAVHRVSIPVVAPPTSER